MKSRTRCADGSIVCVLDSGADVSVITERDSELLVSESDEVIHLNSFMSTSCSSKKSGELGGHCKDFTGNNCSCPLGFGAILSRHTVKDNLLSVPILQSFGYQFWFGQYPYMVTPDGKEVPLYVKKNGYLCLRLHPTSNTDRPVSRTVSAIHRDVNYLDRDVLLWHRRFCHVDGRTLLHMKNKDLVRGLPKHLRSFGSRRCDCLSCGMGKSSKAHVGPINHADAAKNKADKDAANESKQTTFYPLEQIHMDCCQMDSEDIYGNKHFLVIVDRCSSYMWTVPLRDKEDLAIIVEKFLLSVVLPYHRKRNQSLLHEWRERTPHGSRTQPPSLPGLQRIRCDCGSEFLNREMTKLGKRFGFVTDPVAPYVNDGRAEAAVKKLTTATRCCLIDANLRKPFWGPIMDMVCHTLNRTYAASVDAVPYTLLTGLLPDVSYFRQPGCHAVCHVQKRHRKKSDARGFIGILINYDTAKNTWVFLNPLTGKVVRTHHASFFERARAPEEHIDMGAMLLQPPNVDRDRRTSSWYCQLWPQVLYPGMDAERMDPENPHLPNNNPVDLLNSNILFDRDVLKGDKPGLMPGTAVSDEDAGESFSTTVDPPSAGDTENPIPDPLDWEGHVLDAPDSLASWNTLRRTHVDPTNPEVLTAVNTLDGQTVAEALSMPFTSADGGTDRKFSVSDLQFYLSKNLLVLDTPAQLENHDDSESEETEPVRPILAPSHAEDKGKAEALQELETGQTVPLRERTRSARRAAARKLRASTVNGFEYYPGASPGDPTQVQVDGVTKPGIWVITPSLFDSYFQPPPFDDLSQSSPLTTQAHPVDPVTLAQVTHEVGATQGLRDAEGCPLTETAHPVWSIDPSEMPSLEELQSPAEKGRFTDRQGNVRFTYHVRRAVSHHTRDVRNITYHAVNFVMGYPVDAQVLAASSTTNLVDVKAPANSKRAMSSDTHLMWTQCTLEELNGLHDMDCIEYVKTTDRRLKGALVLPSHIVYTAKFTSDVPAKFIKAKARCVAGGNFEPTPAEPFANFSPTAGPCLNRLCDAYAVYKGYVLWTTDCTQAFLNAPTKENIYVRPPPGCGPPGYVWRLKKYLYGLCAAPAAWMETLSNELIAQGFKPFDDDPCLLRKQLGDGSEIIACVFVDDIKWATNNVEALKKVIGSIGDKYKISVGDTLVTSSNLSQVDWCDAEISTYLGMRYTYDRLAPKKWVLKVDQTAYIDKLIKRFHLDDLSGKSTPLPALAAPTQLKERMGKLDDPFLLAWSKEFSFPVIVGSLIHAMVHTRPDIAYAVSILSRYMAKPELHHYKAALHLMRYLKETRTLGIEYRQENMHRQGPYVTAAVEHSASSHHHPTHDCVLEAAADASFADDPETYRSTGGFVVWFGGSPVDYECKRQPLVTMSTLESEYVCASRCVLSIRFIHKFMDFIGLSRIGPTRVHEDNAACIAISNKPVHRMRSKHIGIKYHNVREAVQNGEVDLTPIWTEHNVADIFTKSESHATFLRFREVLLGHKSLYAMMDSYPKPPKDKVGCTVNYVDNECAWPTLRMPLTYDSHVSEILGVSKLIVPGYDVQFVSLEPWT